MTATIVNETADGLTLQVVIPFNRSMLEAEDAISLCTLLEREARIVTSATPRFALASGAQIWRRQRNSSSRRLEKQP